MTDKLSDQLQNAIFKYQTYIPTGLHSELLAIAEGVDKDLEQRVEGLESGLRKLSDPMAYEGIPIFHGTKQPWSVAKQALAVVEEKA